METTSSYYDILSVDRGASSNQIKQAYRQLAKQHHPDKGGSKEQFQQINAAYQVLMDSIKREEYDYMLFQQPYSNESYTPQSTSPGEVKTDEYEFPLDEYSNRIGYLLDNLTSYVQIAVILQEIIPLLEHIHQRWKENDYLEFSSMIAILLMNTVINDANQMAQNYHGYIKIDEKGVKSAYQMLKKIGRLKMNIETASVYFQNKYDLETALRNCFRRKINSIAKITTIFVMISLALLFVIFNGINQLFSFIFLTGLMYPVLYYIIRGTISIIHSLWSIKT